MSPIPASFELERFSVTPVTDGTVLLEVGGVLLDVPPRSAPPRLLVEGTRRARREHNALDFEVEGERLRASFVVSAADAETAGFALAVGGLLLELPAPDPTPGSDRTVVLARELNGARRELARLRSRIEADAEVASGHAAELAAVREEAATREQEATAAAEDRALAAERDAEARVAAAEGDATDRAQAAEASAGARIEAAESRATELEIAASRLETVLADVRASAEQRDATAAADRRSLQDELGAVRADATAARAEAAEAARREQQASAELQTLRSELELARRALDGRDAELARSPDRRARALARPRTVAGVTGEYPAVEPEAVEADPEPSAKELETAPTDSGPPSTDPTTEDGEPAVRAGAPAQLDAGLLPDDTHPTPDDTELVPDGADLVSDHADPVPDGTELVPDGTDADLVPDDTTLALDDADLVSDGVDLAPDDTNLALDDARLVSDDVDLAPDEGDPVPDDEDFDTTMAHDPAPRPEAELPDDTGPIPLRRISERRYAPGADRDEKLGDDPTRVSGAKRDSALSPASDAGPGLPAGLTPRTAVIGVLAIAAFLVLVAILGYVF